MAFVTSPMRAVIAPPPTPLRTSAFTCPHPPTRYAASTIPAGRRGVGARLPVQMGLFGLGAPEIAVIVGVGLLLFGPKKLADYGKKAGSLAGDVKKATAEFREAMDESLSDADAEIEARRASKPVVVEAKDVTPVREAKDVKAVADAKVTEAKKDKRDA
ncbi:hypothetical protein MMPV_006839 [Pyropia vietnamensis]